MGILKNDLFIHTMSLTEEHLSHAVELLRMARAYPMKKAVMKKILAHRFAVSSIIHAFSGLESSINFFGFELFFNSDSARFVPAQKREFLLNKLIRSWDHVSALDKLSFILSYSTQSVLPARLENRLRELNSLRNWLVHGFSYKRTFLVQPSGEPNEYDVVDMEDSVNWAEKFPNTKFKPLNELNAEDARLALEIVFEALKHLSHSMNQPFWIATSDIEYTVLHEDSFDEDVARILAEDDA